MCLSHLRSSLRSPKPSATLVCVWISAIYTPRIRRRRRRESFDTYKQGELPQVRLEERVACVLGCIAL